MPVFRWTLAAMLLATLVACSSAPAAPEGVQDRKNRAADYLKFGRQAFLETQYEQALSFYLIAVDLDTAVDYEAGMAVAWNSVATAQAALGRSPEAEAALGRAEVLAGQSGDRTLMLQVAVNRVQAELAAGRLESAQSRLDEVRPFPTTAEGAALEHAWGTLKKAQELYPEALAALDRSLAINTNLKLKLEMASNRFMKASVQAKLGQWKDAETELLAALELDKAMENTLGIGQDWRALGTVAMKLGQKQEGFDRYQRAYRLFQAAGLTDQQARTLELLIPLAGELQKTDEQAAYRAALARLTPAAK